MDFNIALMANADLETGQNHLMISRPGHNSPSAPYKILEIQSRIIRIHNFRHVGIVRYTVEDPQVGSPGAVHHWAKNAAGCFSESGKGW